MSELPATIADLWAFARACEAGRAHRKFPCRFLGGPTGETVLCPTCTGKVELKVLACSRFGGCTPTQPVEGVACCIGCTSYLPGGIPAEADAFVAALPPYLEGKYSGRGVVISGGGAYWACAYVTVRMLRHVGCSLPVQVWYLGDRERDERYTRLLEPFGVEVVDMLAHPEAKGCRNLTGFPGNPPFQTKSFGVLHSPFREVLCLDADNYPVADPAVLFDEPRYRETGAVFWPDMPATEAWTRWDDWGVPRYGQAKAGLEVGQYVVDKAKVWAPVNLARWYDDHGDWCYGYSRHHDHGDKGPWRVAFAALKRDYTMFATLAKWTNIAFIQPGPDGVTPMFIHRGAGKFVAESVAFRSTAQNGNVRVGLPLEAEAFGYLDTLRAALR